MIYLKLAHRLILTSLLAVLCATGNAQLITDSIVQINEKKFGWLYIPAGTGCVIKEGYVLTAHHVIDDWPTIEVRDRNRRMHKATLVCGEIETIGSDWALLYVPTLKAPALPVRKGKPANGEQITCYHDCKPVSLEVTPSHGIIEDYWFQDKNLRHTTAKVENGFSGSPVVDNQGRLIGVVAMRSELTTEMYFTPYTVIERKLWWLFLDAPAQ